MKQVGLDGFNQNPIHPWNWVYNLLTGMSNQVYHRFQKQEKGFGATISPQVYLVFPKILVSPIAGQTEPQCCCWANTKKCGVYGQRYCTVPGDDGMRWNMDFLIFQIF